VQSTDHHREQSTTEDKGTTERRGRSGKAGASRTPTLPTAGRYGTPCDRLRLQVCMVEVCAESRLDFRALLCEARIEVSPHLSELFARSIARFGPRAPMPPMEVRFYRFTSLNTTIRLRRGAFRVSLSDCWKRAGAGAAGDRAHPAGQALSQADRCRARAPLRRFTSSESVTRQSERIRRRGGGRRLCRRGPALRSG